MQAFYGLGAMIIPILWIWKLRLKEAKELAQGPLAKKWQRKDSNSSSWPHSLCY